jgi:UDP-N-acetylglucosamine--N-acetylmuramyl-(pentapeptide) pyrophosphoryl-undecaprenol N-acetylglucosamine transferase
MMILLAVGGTGGHLFPAQALAEELLERDARCEVLFAGAHLSSNRFLDKDRFRFKEVASATPFRRNPLRACLLLWKGIWQSLKLLKTEKPALIVGFGSYHSFPVLCAAKLLGIPFVLFEADTIPGKVNRVLSRYARFTAVHFSPSASFLKGKAIPVCMPSRHRPELAPLSIEDARASLGLFPHRFTLLVFGGSQGAKGINHHILSLLALLKTLSFPIQIIHITGSEEMSVEIKKVCAHLGISAYVKEFEVRMREVWTASTLVIGRSGASTLAEMIQYEVPGIVIPYPYASDAHQKSNARFLQHEVKGGICLLEEEASAALLCEHIAACEKKLEYYKVCMRQYKEAQHRETLGKLIYEHFEFH